MNEPTELHHAEWIWFELVGSTKSGKTHVWHVRSNRSGDFLGRVAWFSRWRQYAFHPEADTVYNAGCMRDVADFCEWQNREHRRACGTASPRKK